MLDLYYNCFDKSGDVNYFEELKKDTDLLYLAFAEENLFDCDRPEKKDSKGKMRENDSEIHLEKIEIQIFFHECLVALTRNTINESLDCLKKDLGIRGCCLCSKTFCCFDDKSDKIKFSSKGLNKIVLEESRHGPMAKYKKLLDEAINLISINKRFGTIHHMVAAYEQTKKGLSYFYPKKQVQDGGRHKKSLNL